MYNMVQLQTYVTCPTTSPLYVHMYCILHVKELMATAVSSIVTSHAAGTGSIPRRVTFLVEFFLGFCLKRKTNFKKFRPHSSPVIIWPSYIIRLRTATVSDHSCSTCPSLNNKQQHKFGESLVKEYPKQELPYVSYSLVGE